MFQCVCHALIHLRGQVLKEELNDLIIKLLLVCQTLHIRSPQRHAAEVEHLLLSIGGRHGTSSLKLLCCSTALYCFNRNGSSIVPNSVYIHTIFSTTTCIIQQQRTITLLKAIDNSPSPWGKETKRGYRSSFAVIRIAAMGTSGYGIFSRECRWISWLWLRAMCMTSFSGVSISVISCLQNWYPFNV